MVNVAGNLCSLTREHIDQRPKTFSREAEITVELFFIGKLWGQNIISEFPLQHTMVNLFMHRAQMNWQLFWEKVFTKDIIFCYFPEVFKSQQGSMFMSLLSTPPLTPFPHILNSTVSICLVLLHSMDFFLRNSRIYANPAAHLHKKFCRIFLNFPGECRQR